MVLNRSCILLVLVLILVSGIDGLSMPTVIKADGYLVSIHSIYYFFNKADCDFYYDTSCNRSNEFYTVKGFEIYEDRNYHLLDSLLADHLTDSKPFSRLNNSCSFDDNYYENTLYMRPITIEYELYKRHFFGESSEDLNFCIKFSDSNIKVKFEVEHGIERLITIY